MLESLLDEILRQHFSEESKLHGRWGGRRDVNNAEEVTPCGARRGLSTRPGRVEVSCWVEETRREGTLWEEELSRREEGKEKQLRSSHFDSFGDLIEELLRCPEATGAHGKFRHKADRWAKCYARGSHSAEVLYMCWKRERQDAEAPLKAEMETQLQHIKASNHSGNKGKRCLWRKWQRPWFPIVCSLLTRS